MITSLRVFYIFCLGVFALLSSISEVHAQAANDSQKYSDSYRVAVMRRLPFVQRDLKNLHSSISVLRSTNVPRNLSHVEMSLYNAHFGTYIVNHEWQIDLLLKSVTNLIDTQHTYTTEALVKQVQSLGARSDSILSNMRAQVKAADAQASRYAYPKIVSYIQLLNNADPFRIFKGNVL